MKKYTLKNGEFIAISVWGVHLFKEMDDIEFIHNTTSVDMVTGYQRTGKLASYFSPPLTPKEAYDKIQMLGLDADSFLANQATPDDEVGQWDTLKDELKHEPKCDCGGQKCNLPCFDWCSTQKKN